MWKVPEAGSILRKVFALLKWPRLHRTYNYEMLIINGWDTDPVRKALNLLNIQLCRLEMAPLQNRQYYNEEILSGEKYLKRASKLFFMLSPIATNIRTFKWDVMHPCSLRDCKTAKGQIWRSEKILPLGLICTTRVQPEFESRIFFWCPTLTSCSFAALGGKRMQSTSFESPNKEKVDLA